MIWILGVLSPAHSTLKQCSKQTNANANARDQRSRLSGSMTNAKNITPSDPERSELYGERTLYDRQIDEDCECEYKVQCAMTWVYGGIA